MLIPEDVHKLTLVFVDSLDLDIKEGVGIDADPAALLNQSSQTSLVILLDLHPGSNELRIIGKLGNVLQLIQMAEPRLTTQVFGNQRTQLGISLMKPSKRRKDSCLRKCTLCTFWG